MRRIEKDGKNHKETAIEKYYELHHPDKEWQERHKLMWNWVSEDRGREIRTWSDVEDWELDKLLEVLG